MPVIKLRIFSFVLLFVFTRVNFMKYTRFTSLFIFGLCVPYGANALTIFGVDDLNGIDSVQNENFLINGAGTYSLSKLKSVVGDGFTITVDGGMAHIDLAVDNSFLGDNVFDKGLVVENEFARIVLDDSFVSGISGEVNELLVFTNLDHDRLPDVVQSTPSADYVYDWNTAGTTVSRRYSDAYIAAHNISSGLTGIDSIIQYTPSVLLRPVTIINQHELFDTYNFADDYFISVVPEYYNARDFNDMGLRLNMGTKFGGRLFAGLSAYLSTANFKYGVDDFDYVVYGGNLRVLYELNDTMFVRSVGGLSLATIKSSVENNPNIFSSYFGADIGANFNFESGLYVSPFVGYGMTNAAVLGVHDNTYLLHTGSDVGFKYFMDGVSYSYNLRAGVNTGGYVDASVGMNAWTVSDKIGGGVSIGVVDTEFGWSGKFSANVRFAF